MLSEIETDLFHGHLYVHHLPGVVAGYMPGAPRDGFEEFLTDAREYGISTVVCLVEDFELNDAPEYRDAIAEGTLATGAQRCKVIRLPVVDGDVPTPDHEAEYLQAVKAIAERVRLGRAVLVHCKGGVGRTATFSISVLLELGVELEDAVELSREAGPYPHGIQYEFLKRIA